MHRNAFTVLEIQKGRNRKKINITISTKNVTRTTFFMSERRETVI